VDRLRILSILDWLFSSNDAEEFIKNNAKFDTTKPSIGWSREDDLELLNFTYDKGYDARLLSIYGKEKDSYRVLIENRISLLLEGYLEKRQKTERRKRSLEDEDIRPKKKLKVTHKETAYRMLLQYGAIQKSDGSMNWKKLITFGFDELHHVDTEILEELYEDFKEDTSRLATWRKLLNSKIDPPKSGLTWKEVDDLKKNLELMKMVREEILPNLPASVSISKVGLPIWWSDENLIRGLLRHGFGQWSCIFTDEELWGNVPTERPTDESCEKRVQLLVSFWLRKQEHEKRVRQQMRQQQQMYAMNPYMQQMRQQQQMFTSGMMGF